MSQSKPKSILKNPLAQGSSSKSSQGSKLKHTLAVASSSSQVNGEVSKKGSKGKVTIQAKKRHQDSDDDDEDDDEDMDGEEGSDEEISTGDEIDAAKDQKTGKKKQTKRKAPTTAETFGSTLTSLLTESSRPSKKSKPSNTDPSSESALSAKKNKSQTTAPILSLSKTTLPPTKSQVSLELKAARVLRKEKEEREDRARVRNVVEGWSQEAAGMGSQEFEKGLRKTAQRGVIKLFNAILVASKASEETTSTSLAARAGVKPEQPKSAKEKDNIMGRGGREGLTKESFLELVRKGGK